MGAELGKVLVSGILRAVEASGSRIRTTTIRPKQQPANDQEAEPLARRETLEFVRAYYRIKESAVRKQIFELTKAVARSLTE